MSNIVTKRKPGRPRKVPKQQEYEIEYEDDEPGREPGIIHDNSDDELSSLLSESLSNDSDIIDKRVNQKTEFKLWKRKEREINKKLKDQKRKSDFDGFVRSANECREHMHLKTLIQDIIKTKYEDDETNVLYEKIVNSKWNIARSSRMN